MVRRGNTIINYVDENNKEKYFMGRKGFIKFFDLKY